MSTPARAEGVLSSDDSRQLDKAHRRLDEAVAAYEPFLGGELNPGTEGLVQDAGVLARAQIAIEDAEGELWRLRDELLGLVAAHLGTPSLDGGRVVLGRRRRLRRRGRRIGPIAAPVERGRVVLVPFPYSDLQGLKRRPACVVSSGAYNDRHPDVVLAMITSSPPARTARPWRCSARGLGGIRPPVAARGSSGTASRPGAAAARPGARRSLGV